MDEARDCETIPSLVSSLLIDKRDGGIWIRSDWSPRDAIKPCFQSDSLFDADADMREGAGRLAAGRRAFPSIGEIFHMRLRKNSQSDY